MTKNDYWCEINVEKRQDGGWVASAVELTDVGTQGNVIGTATDADLPTALAIVGRYIIENERAYEAAGDSE